MSNKTLLTVTQACTLFQFKKGFLYYLTRTKQIPHYKFGKLIRFDPVELAAWSEKQRKRAVAN